MRIRFGLHDLDENLLLLRRLGQRVALRPMVFDLLVHLARNRDRVVRREELIHRLWGDTAVGQGSLSGLVNELRKALGESGRGPSTIRTVHARGYQFVAPVESEAGAPGCAGGAGGDPAALNGASAAPPGGTGIPGRRVAADGRVSHCSMASDAASLDPSRAALQALFDRARRGAARGLLIELEATLAPSELLGRVGEEALRQGFEALSIPVSRSHESVESVLVERVLDGLIESRGIDCIRSALPGRSIELLDRSIVSGPLRPVARIDPLQARQYAERCWRSLARLLCALSETRPVALVLEDLDEVTGEALERVASLLRLCEGSPFVIVATVDLSKCGGGLSASFLGDGRLDVLSLERDRLRREELLDRLIAARGLPPLPASLARALGRYVEGVRAQTETVASGLVESIATHVGVASDPAMEAMRTSGVEGQEAPSRVMRRVPPRSSPLEIDPPASAEMSLASRKGDNGKIRKC